MDVNIFVTHDYYVCNIVIKYVHSMFSKAWENVYQRDIFFNN